MSYSEEILEVLFKSRRWMTTTEVAKETGFSWNTAQGYLEDLSNDGYVLHRKSGNRELWKFNFVKWSKMKRGSIK